MIGSRGEALFTSALFLVFVCFDNGAGRLENRTGHLAKVHDGR